MTKQTEEALKMAIEAMERAEEVDWELNSLHVLNILQAIQACKEALEQPAQGSEQAPCEQPVAWMHRHAGEITEFNDFQSCQYCEPLYTHPCALARTAPSWQGNKEFVGLSDDEILIICAKMAAKLPNKEIDLIFARAIEQALRERNCNDTK